MNLKGSILGIFGVLIYYSVALLSVNGNCEQELAQVKETWKAYQSTTLLALKRIFHEEQACSPCTACEHRETGVRKELRRSERNLKYLAKAMMIPAYRKPLARSYIPGRLNASLKLSCGSPGEGLNLCLWERKVKGQEQTIVIDTEIVERGGATPIKGVRYFRDGLNDCMCSLGRKSRGTPIVMSTLHFLDASQDYVHLAEGLKANREHHSTFVDLDPVTGSIFRLHKRFQLNIDLKRNVGLAHFISVPEVMYPILWTDESVLMDDATWEYIKRLHS